MDELRIAIGVAAIALTFAGWVPYIRDILRKKTHPHVYSWFLWGSTALIAFALQFDGGGGIASFVTLAAGLVCLVVVALALRNGKHDIRRSDTVFLAVALLALVLWLVADQPALSITLLAAVEVLGFAPTIRKSWDKPHSETLSSYVMNTIRFGLSIAAIAHFSYVTVVYPATWMVANGAFAAMLIVRRRTVAKLEVTPTRA
jgi:hypothetical protein